MVEPGQTFDFLDVIGPITSPPYTAGAAIIHGRTVMDGALGGGMCSCSTTLFNAAMRAGLDMGARRNHSYYITRYPVGLDATVWIASARSRQTMSFTNDLQYPILIRGINAPGAVTFELYGVSDGRTVTLSEPRIENEKVAVDQFQYTNELAPGVRNRIEFNADGFWSWVTRTVRDSSGAVIHEDVFHSRYKTITGVTLGRPLSGRSTGRNQDPGCQLPAPRAAGTRAASTRVDDPREQPPGRELTLGTSKRESGGDGGESNSPSRTISRRPATSVSDDLSSIDRSAIGSVLIDPSTFPCGLCYRLRDLVDSASPLNDASTTRGDGAASTLTLPP